LAIDSYEAEVARVTLEAAGEQIDILEAQIRLLEERQPAATRKCLIEYANLSHGPNYVAALKAVTNAVAPLLGLARVVDDRAFYSSGPTIRTCRASG
jgi:hypothetical protein